MNEERRLMNSPEPIDDIMHRCERYLAQMLPTPWGYDGYSRVVSGPLAVQAENDQSPEYPDGPRPGPPFFNEPGGEADRDWCEQHHAAYGSDPVVCVGPAEYGDTSMGAHAVSLAFIADAPSIVQRLMDEIRDLRRQIAGESA